MATTGGGAAAAGGVGGGGGEGVIRLRDEFLSLCLNHAEVRRRDARRRSGCVGLFLLLGSSVHPPSCPSLPPPPILCPTIHQGLRDEQLREHFAERYLQLVPIINSCLAEVRWREERSEGDGGEVGRRGKACMVSKCFLVKCEGDAKRDN